MAAINSLYEQICESAYSQVAEAFVAPINGQHAKSRLPKPIFVPFKADVPRRAVSWARRFTRSCGATTPELCG